MAIIRAKQGVITRVLPHQGNRRYLIPGGTRGYPLGAGGITPTLDFNFAADKSLVANIGPTLTCTRASEATYFDASGVLQTAANNAARFDHDPSASNASLGLLVEEARTNTATWTESFDNAAWTKNEITIDTNAATAPDGATTADRFNTAATTNFHRAYQSYTITADSTNYTTSAYFKADGNNYPVITWQRSLAEYFIAATFDLTTGTVGSTDVGTSGGTIVDSGCESVGNGWYRCWLSGTNTGGSVFFVISLADSASPTYNDKGSVSFLGVEGEDLLVWGADCQVGSFPTSYIPNDSATATVTRAADVVSSTDVTWLDQSAGSIYWKGTNNGYTPNFTYIFDVSGNASNRYSMFIDKADGSADFDTFTGIGTDGGIDGTQDFVLGVESEMVAGFANNDLIVYLDGVSGGTEAAATIPCSGALTTLSVGCFNATSNHMNGHIARIVYYNERLTDTQLEDLSNGTFP